MARTPYPVAKARRALDTWIALRVDQAPEDAPITVAAALQHLNTSKIKTHRATLSEHGLHVVVAAGKQQQKARGGRQVNAERTLYDEQLRALRSENTQLEQQNRTLLGQIAVMVHNARRLSISHDELTAPMTPILPADDGARLAPRPSAAAPKPGAKGRPPRDGRA